MEISLTVFLMLSAFAAYANRALLTAGLCAGLAVLARPEAVLLDLRPERLEMPEGRRERYDRRIAAFRSDDGYETAFEQDGILLLLRRDIERAGAR